MSSKRPTVIGTRYQTASEIPLNGCLEKAFEVT